MNIIRVLFLRNWQVAARTAAGAGLRGIALLFLLTFASSGAWAQGLPLTDCPRGSNPLVKKYYLCLGDIVTIDGASAGIYLVDPVTGNQTPISTAVNATTSVNGTIVNLLLQASSVTIEPGTGKLLAAGRQYGVVRVDPKDGSQELLLRGGIGWGAFPTLSSGDPFIYPGGITIDPVDSSILVTDTGIRLNQCTNANDVTTCLSDPGKIIRITKALGSAPGVYSGNVVIAKGVLLSNPFDIAVDGNNGVASNIYVTDMSARLGGETTPRGMGGIIYLDATSTPAFNQTVFFSSYGQNPTATPPTSGSGCPMGITMVPPLTVNGVGYPARVFATLFSYNGFGCAPQAVFSVTPNLWLPTSPGSNFQTIFSGSPLQYPFGMDTDLSGRVIIADEGSGYGCFGTIFRLDLTKPIVTSGSLSDLNPFALSPIAGGGCSPPNQTFLVNPADAAVVKVAVPVLTANATPVVTNLSATSAVEGGSSILSGTFTDTDAGQTHAVNITWGDGSAGTVINLAAGTSGFSATHQYLDNGSYNISVGVADNLGATGNGSTTALVTNANPVFGTVTGPTAPVALGNVVTVTGNFTDAGTKDTHTCSFNWDDGATTAGTVSETNGSGSCTGTHNYTATGVYSVTLVVTDKDGGTATSYFKYAVVFSTTEGSVTGNGWFKTLAGGYPLSAVDEGRTKFGFEVKYKAGSALPSGKFEFQFKVGDDDDEDKHPERIKFKLRGTSFAWLVISGFESQFQGTGTINGAGNYTFLVTAYDGQRTGGGGVDKIRVKIWETATGTLIYDNRQGSPDDMDFANPQPIGGGRVQIRTTN